MTGTSWMRRACARHPREAGMDPLGMDDPGIAASGVADPEMSDADFEKLAAGLGPQAEIAPTY